jgi:outer membrane immunogenic protein
MRFQLACFLAVSTGMIASASAADLPAKPVYKAPAAIVAYNWSGWYVGAFVGVTATRSRGLDPEGSPTGEFENTGVGFTGGGTVGYNWELGASPFGGRWLVGLEGDLGYFGDTHSVHEFNDTFIYNTKTNWLGTARGRVGIANGPNLSYLTGGYARMRFTDSNRLTTPAGTEISSTETKSGWTVGSGVETMLGGGWTAKSETLYINMGGGNPLLQRLSDLDSVVNEHRYYTQRFGVNYLFGGGATGPLPQTNWNGFYAGIVGGGVVSSVRATGFGGGGIAGDEIGNNGTGFTAGGQVGWNWMIGPKVVVGVEGDISWMGVDHTTFNYFNATTAILGVDTSWFATARGRLAYNTGPALLYVTGGGAWVHVDNFWQGDDGATGTGFTISKTLSGWTIGGGIETTLWGNWSSKNEYLYVDVGDGPVLTSPAPGIFSVTVDHRFHMFRSALVYRFN